MADKINWLVDDYNWRRIIEGLAALEKSYCIKAFEGNENVTRKQAKSEFWHRLTAAQGFDLIIKEKENDTDRN